jgi:hypothetical protein
MKVFRIIELVFGILLLLPAVYSVLIFPMKDDKLQNSIWTGFSYVAHDMHGGAVNTVNYTSALPFYFGLMAIAGAYLIKDSKK